MPGPKCLKRDSGGKNGQLTCYQCVFHQTEANLATIQLQNHQNVKKKKKILAKGSSCQWVNHVTQFSKRGSFCATFEKTMPTKLENSRNSAKFRFLRFQLRQDRVLVNSRSCFFTSDSGIFLLFQKKWVGRRRAMGNETFYGDGLIKKEIGKK